MEQEKKDKMKKFVKTAVYEGLPLIGGIALAASLVPLDGGATLIKTGSSLTVAGVAKFGLVTIVGYGAVKSAITPDQMVTFEAAAQKLADRIYQMRPEKTEKPAEEAAEPAAA